MKVAKSLSSIKLHFHDSELLLSLSAILRTPDGFLWFASDERNSLVRLSVRPDGSFGDPVTYHLSDLLELSDPDEEIDLEGLAYEAPYLWVIGSHSRKMKGFREKDDTDAARIRRLEYSKVELPKNRCLIARIPYVNNQLWKEIAHPTDPSQMLSAAKIESALEGNLLMECLRDDPHIGPIVVCGLPTKGNGLDIEGSEIRNGKLYLGLRGPVLKDWAIILELDPKTKKNNASVLGLRKIVDDKRRYRKFFVNLHGLGIRDLCFHNNELIILAGPTMYLHGPMRIYRLKDAENLAEDQLYEPDYLFDIPCSDDDSHPKNGFDHAEGITLFPGKGDELGLLTIFDSPRKDRLLKDSVGVLADWFSFSGESKKLGRGRRRKNVSSAK
jgi:hypothetical protein